MEKQTTWVDMRGSCAAADWHSVTDWSVCTALVEHSWDKRLEPLPVAAIQDAVAVGAWAILVHFAHFALPRPVVLIR